MPDPTPQGSGRNPREYGSGVSSGTVGKENSNSEAERENMLRACRRVKADGGAAGVDRMSVEELAEEPKAHWQDFDHLGMYSFLDRHMADKAIS